MKNLYVIVVQTAGITVQKTFNTMEKKLLKTASYLRGFIIGLLVEYSLRVEISWLPLTILILILIISVFDITDKK